MKIEKVNREEFLPEIIQSIVKLQPNEALKITDYDQKSPMPQYLRTYFKMGILKNGSIQTKKIDSKTYLITKK